MRKPRNDHGIEDEPGISADDAIRSHQDDALHSVWDESQTVIDDSHAMSNKRLTYRVWLLERIERTTSKTSWLATIVLVLMSGPWAIAGAILQQSSFAHPWLLLVVIAPITEEIMKAAATMWAVEVRPYLFRNRIQILITMIAAGVGFASIENLVYLNVYIPDPSPRIIVWRWTVCLFLHTSCAAISAIGLMSSWQDAIQHKHRPRLALASPYLISAVVTHAIYNAAVLLLPFV